MRIKKQIPWKTRKHTHMCHSRQQGGWNYILSRNKFWSGACVCTHACVCGGVSSSSVEELEIKIQKGLTVAIASRGRKHRRQGWQQTTYSSSQCAQDLRPVQPGGGQAYLVLYLPAQLLHPAILGKGGAGPIRATALFTKPARCLTSGITWRSHLQCERVFFC